MEVVGKKKPSSTTPSWYYRLKLASCQPIKRDFPRDGVCQTFDRYSVDKDGNGDPILMLNVFAQTLKLHLACWSVHGDKTNEPGCLKNHLAELFTMYPCLKLLTGDALAPTTPASPTHTTSWSLRPLTL